MALKRPESEGEEVHLAAPLAEPPVVPEEAHHVQRARAPYRLTLDADALLMVPDPTPVAGGGELLLRYQWAQRLTMRAGMAEQQVAVPIEAGEIEIRVHVALTAAIR